MDRNSIVRPFDVFRASKTMYASIDYDCRLIFAEGGKPENPEKN